MSPLKMKLTEDMKQAMRDHNSLKLNAIRFLLSELKNWEIDHGEQDDAGVLTIINREVKKIKDALVDFEKAGRQDLIDEERQKLEVLQSYLPQQLSDAELEQRVATVVAQSEKKDFGLIMKAVMAEVHGQTDGGRVSAAVKKALG